MTLNLKNQLTGNLLKFENDIAKTRKPFIRLNISDNKPTKINQSKIGGNPYLPLSVDYPTNKKGKPLLHLAQINLAEMPAFDGFPASGILQFYISAFDEMMGLDFENPTTPSNFRVIFHENPDASSDLQSDFSFLDDLPFSPIQYKKPRKITFEAQEEVCGIVDFRFAETIGAAMEAQAKGNNYYDLEDAYAKTVKNDGHKMGGYGYFTQEDPREESHEVLLFQLDSDEKHGILWGDMGVCNFFINADDLKNKDFSKVWYNWDCF